MNSPRSGGTGLGWGSGFASGVAAAGADFRAPDGTGGARSAGEAEFPGGVDEAVASAARVGDCAAGVPGAAGKGEPEAIGIAASGGGVIGAAVLGAPCADPEAMAGSRP